MPCYITQASYTSEAWVSQITDPQSHVEHIRSIVEEQGGKVLGAYLSFGEDEEYGQDEEYDVVLITEFPDHVSASAVGFALAASDGCKAQKTTPLLTSEEEREAMRRARDILRRLQPLASNIEDDRLQLHDQTC